MLQTVKPRERALDILRQHGPLTAQAFARKLWPNSPGWKRRSRRHGDNNAGALGVGITMGAGAFLERMHKAGLVRIVRTAPTEWEAT